MVNPSADNSCLPKAIHSCVPKCCYKKKKLKHLPQGPVGKVNNLKPSAAQLNNLVNPENDRPRRHRKLDSSGVLDYFDMKNKEEK